MPLTRGWRFTKLLASQTYVNMPTVIKINYNYNFEKCVLSYEM